MELFNALHGSFLGANFPWYLAASIIVVLAVGYTGASLVLWTLALAAILIGFNAPVWALTTFAVIALVFNVKPLRTILLTSFIMKLMKGFLPKISETEKVALEAGVVWVEKDLFSGKPDLKKLLKETYPKLTREEQAFLDGPVERLCEVLDDWKIWQDKEIPREAWDIMKKEKFFGMIIPKEYGGLGFSALANSSVVMKVATRSCAACVTVMVPNS
ncbi:MAG: acyl-CoA dehydrogenase family protein, partial [Deltaproteobacteria bacterium]|nr:acyl-CoA dehydrogenase family protein [Deltaproteobacteria bacterium]